MYTHQFREFFWSIERVKKQASFYGFMTSFGSLNSIYYYYSIISKCNKTYSRTTAIIFQRVVKSRDEKGNKNYSSLVVEVAAQMILQITTLPLPHILLGHT